MRHKQVIKFVRSLLDRHSYSTREERDLCNKLINAYIGTSSLCPDVWVSLLMEFADKNPSLLVEIFLPHDDLFSVGGDLMQAGNLRTVLEDEFVSIHIRDKDNKKWVELARQPITFTVNGYNINHLYRT